MGVSVHTGGNPICKVVLIPGIQFWNSFNSFDTVLAILEMLLFPPSLYLNVSGCYLNLTSTLNKTIVSLHHMITSKISSCLCSGGIPNILVTGTGTWSFNDV